MNIELDAQQCAALALVVEHRLANLSTELRRTDRANFKEELRTEREVLRSVLPLLEPVAAR